MATTAHLLLHRLLISPAVWRGAVEAVVAAADPEGVAEGLGVLCRYGEEDLVHGRALRLVQQCHQLAQPRDEHPARDVSALRHRKC